MGACSIVDSDDPAKWAEAIERVCVRHGVCLEEIKMLRECYGKKYVWKTKCKALAEQLWRMISDDQSTVFQNCSLVCVHSHFSHHSFIFFFTYKA